MSKIQRPRRITSEGIPNESKQAVDTIGSSVNTFMDETYTAIMSNLSIADNLNMEIKTIKVTVDSNGVPTNNVTYKSGIKGKTQGMIVIRTLLAYPTALPAVSFVDNSGLITISNVKGLTVDTEYQLVVLAIGG